MFAAAVLSAVAPPESVAPVPAFPGQYAPPAGLFPVWPSGCDNREGSEKTACLQSVAFDFADLKRYAEANEELGHPERGKPRVIFFGDSITDVWSNPWAGGFFSGKAYVNRGISGQTTAQMLLRFRADVINNDPAAVVILAGTNDVAGNAGPASVTQIQGNLASMAELAKAHGVRVVLASLLPVCDCKNDDSGGVRVQTVLRPPVMLRALNEWLAAYAAKNGFVYLDYATAMADGDGMLKADLTDDGLHPNRAGYAIMSPLAEKAIARALGRR
jgi:lysophospholipase L1-like esterase